MNSACPKELATEILSDSDLPTKVAPTTLRPARPAAGFDKFGWQGESTLTVTLRLAFRALKLPVL